MKYPIGGATPEVRRRRIVVSVATLAGPVAWAIDLLGSYLLVDRVRETGSKLPLAVTTLLCLGIALTGSILAWRAYRAAAPEGERSAWRSVALSGAAMGVAFAIVIAGQAIPKVVVGAWQ
jgi:hypothetical protein